MWQAVTVTIGAEAASIKFKLLGFCAILPAEGSAYSAYAPLNCSFVAPYTSSSSLNPETSAPNASTIPDSSEPRILGKGWSLTLPSRISASQLPTPAAFTRTSSCPAAGWGRGRSSFMITFGGPNRRTRAAFICSPFTHLADTCERWSPDQAASRFHSEADRGSMKKNMGPLPNPLSTQILPP